MLLIEGAWIQDFGFKIPDFRIPDSKFLISGWNRRLQPPTARSSAKMSFSYNFQEHYAVRFQKTYTFEVLITKTCKQWKIPEIRFLPAEPIPKP